MANGMQAMQGMGGGFQPQSYKLGGNRWSLGRFFGGSQDRINQIPTVTPQVSQALNQLLQSGLSGIQNPQAGFEPIAAQARTQFQQQTIPSIAERFTNLGGKGSGEYVRQLGEAGAGLDQGLAALGAQYGQQNQQNALQQLRLGMMPQFENIHTPGSKGLVSSLFGPALQGLGSPLSAQNSGQGQELFQLLAKLLPLLLG